MEGLRFRIGLLGLGLRVLYRFLEVKVSTEPKALERTGSWFTL